MLSDVHCHPTPFAPIYASPKLILVTPQGEGESGQRSHSAFLSDNLAYENPMEPGSSTRAVGRGKRGKHESAFDGTTRTPSLRRIHTINPIDDSVLLPRAAEEQCDLVTISAPYPERLNNIDLSSAQGNFPQKDTVLVAPEKKPPPSATKSGLSLCEFFDSTSSSPPHAPHYQSPRYVTSLSKPGREQALDLQQKVPSDVSKQSHATPISDIATATHHDIYNFEFDSNWHSSNESRNRFLAVMRRAMRADLRRAPRSSIQNDRPQPYSTEDAGTCGACLSKVRSTEDKIETNDEQSDALGRLDDDRSEETEPALQTPEYSARNPRNTTQPKVSALPAFSNDSQDANQSKSRPNMRAIKKAGTAHYCAKVAYAFSVLKQQRRLHFCRCCSFLPLVRRLRHGKLARASSRSYAAGNRGHASLDSPPDTMVMYSHLPQSGRASTKVRLPQYRDFEKDREERHARRWLRITARTHTLSGACLIFISMGAYVAFPSTFMASQFTQRCIIFRLCTVAAVIFSAKSCKGMRLHASKVLRVLPR